MATNRPITAAFLAALFTGFKTNFRGGFAGVSPQWPQVATLVPSTARSETYSWLGSWPQIREWIGDRVLNQLSASSYTVTNKDYESTVTVKKNDIDDDQLGIFAPMFEELGRTTAAFPDTLVFALLAAGFTNVCYDGQFFFDTDHPVMVNGVETSVSNHGGGAGTPWFLLDTTRALKPLIYQKRQDFDLTALTDPTDENVFKRKEFVYGVDGRASVGFGFWQMAYGSKQTLDATSFEAARSAMTAFKDDSGKPLGVKGNLLVVPGTLEGAARRLLKRSQISGSDNEWEGAAEILVCPWL